MDIELLESFILKNKNKDADEIGKLYEYLVELNKGEGLKDDFTMLKVSFA